MILGLRVNKAGDRAQLRLVKGEPRRSSIGGGVGEPMTLCLRFEGFWLLSRASMQASAGYVAP